MPIFGDEGLTVASTVIPKYSRNFDYESVAAAGNLAAGSLETSTWTIDNSVSDTASNCLKISNNSVDVSHEWQYDTNAQFSSGDFTATFAYQTHTVNISDGNRGGLMFRVNGAGTTGYAAMVRPQAGNTTVRLSSFSAGTETVISTVDIGSQILADTWYYVKVFASGSTIKVRLWKKGDSEPSTWFIDTTDSTYNNSNVKVGYHFHGGSASLRYIYIDSVVEQ